MARITVEDCLQKVGNRFELIQLAAQRARELGAGAEPTVPVNRDKPTMVALREIAAGTVQAERLRDALVKRMQRREPDDGQLWDGPDDDQYAAYARDQQRSPFDSVADPDVDQTTDAGDVDLAEPSDEQLAEMAEDFAFDDRAA